MLRRALPRWTSSRGHSSLRRRLLATESAPRLVKVALEPLTAEAFAPFGEICGTMAGGEPSLCVPSFEAQWRSKVRLPDFAVGARMQPRRGRDLDLAHPVRGRFSHQCPLHSLPRFSTPLLLT